MKLESFKKFLSMFRIQCELLDITFDYKLYGFAIYDFILNQEKTNNYTMSLFIEQKHIMKILSSLEKLEKITITSSYSIYKRLTEIDVYKIVCGDVNIEININNGTVDEMIDIEDLYMDDTGLKSFNEHNFFKLINTVKNKKIQLNAIMPTDIATMGDQKRIVEIMTKIEEYKKYGFEITTGFCYTDEGECSICYDTSKDDKTIFETNCGHHFCKTCIFRHMTTFSLHNNLKCPLCRTDISFKINY